MQVRRLENVLVLLGDDLVPTPCALFEWSETDGAVVRIEPMTSIPAITSTVVVVPAFYNAHTHVSDGILADAATGLTLEEAVFRPAGLKYRELAKVAPAQLAAAAACTLESMARTGTVVHCDFTEQGVAGVTALRSASAAKPTTTARSIICSQLSLPPFSAEQLKRNAPEDTLPPGTLEELDQLWGRESSGSDGFSENTMNDLTDAAWRALRDLTTNKYPNKLRAIHCLESQVYRTASVEMSADRKGDLVRALELYDPHIIVHLTEADDDEIALLAASGKPGVLCPRANAVLVSLKQGKSVLYIMNPFRGSACRRSTSCSRARRHSSWDRTTSCSTRQICWQKWISPTSSQSHRQETEAVTSTPARSSRWPRSTRPRSLRPFSIAPAVAALPWAPTPTLSCLTLVRPIFSFHETLPLLSSRALHQLTSCRRTFPASACTLARNHSLL